MNIFLELKYADMRGKTNLPILGVPQTHMEYANIGEAVSDGTSQEERGHLE